MFKALWAWMYANCQRPRQSMQIRSDCYEGCNNRICCTSNAMYPPLHNFESVSSITQVLNQSKRIQTVIEEIWKRTKSSFSIHFVYCYLMWTPSKRRGQGKSIGASFSTTMYKLDGSWNQFSLSQPAKPEEVWGTEMVSKKTANFNLWSVHSWWHPSYKQLAANKSVKADEKTCSILSLPCPIPWKLKPSIGAWFALPCTRSNQISVLPAEIECLISLLKPILVRVVL